MKNNLQVSVIIPVIEINHYIIFENLPSLNKQTYKNFEVIILPNKHSKYDDELLKKYKWLRIIMTEKISRPALKRDIGANKAKGDILAFIDDDAFPTAKWLENSINIFNKNKVSAVCGPGILPKTASNWEIIFDEVLRTQVGSGGYTYRFIPKKERYVEDYPSMNLLIYKDVFINLGGFNNDYWPGEDSKLCNDLIYKKKRKILYHPDVSIFHHRRKDIKGYLKQHANYGFHRGAFFAQGDKNSRRLTYLIPTFFVTYLIIFIGSLFLSSNNLISNSLFSFISIPLVIYLIILILTLFNTLARQKNLLISILTPIILFLTHFIYGIIFVIGYMKGLQNPSNIYDKR